MSIPIRILEQIDNSELNAADFYETYGKQEVEDSLTNLRKSNQEILDKYTPEQMRVSVLEKLANKENKQTVQNDAAESTAKKYKPDYMRFIQFAAAAVILCALMIPAALGARARLVATNPDAADTVRVKGNADTKAFENRNPKINLYRLDGDTITTLKNGASAKSGDVIQITYNAGNKDYGVIFSVDGNGNITRHFPEDSWKAEPLHHNYNETPLDFSYELDNAPDFECFIMVTSKEQFSLDDLESKIKNKTDIDYLRRLSYLPKKTDGIIFVLDK